MPQRLVRRPVDRGLAGWVVAAITTLLLTAGIPMTTSAFTATVRNTGNSSTAKARFLCADTFAAQRRKQKAYFEYAFAEDAGSTTAQDSSDAGNTGSYEGSNAKDTDAPIACPYDGGGAYRLDGSSRVITTQQDGPVVSGFSEEIWFKAASAGKLIGYEIERSGESSNYDKHLYIDGNGRLRYGTDGNGVQTLATGGSVLDGTWHHAVATTSSTQGSVLYVDGAAVASDVTMTAGEPFSGYWRIGEGKLGGWPDDPGRRYVVGSLRFAAAYPYVLTADEVASAWSIGRPGAGTGGPGPTADPTASASASPTASSSASASPAASASASPSASESALTPAPKATVVEEAPGSTSTLSPQDQPTTGSGG